MLTFDYETEGIENRPKYPPKPVGVAIGYPDGRTEYLSWAAGAGENNIAEEDAKRKLRGLLETHGQLLVHNMKFEYEVTQKWLGWVPDVRKFHDTMLLAFLNDPHSDTLSLKPLGEKLLGMAPEERDAVKDWILANVPEAKRKPSTAMAYICRAPGDLVGKYAIGDVVRTRALFDLLHPKIIENGMEAAYLRERKLIPIMIENEQEGIKCDVANLEIHTKECELDFEKADSWIRAYLHSPELNLDENDPLADALEREGKVTQWVFTETGARSTAKPALKQMLDDKLLYAALMYRGSMATCIRTFMKPWLELAKSNGGRVYTTWNTTRQESGGGTRTGRLSSSKPLNLQNIPNDFEEKLGDLFEQTGLYAELDVGELPNMRSYIIADSPDHVLLGRDFSSQEPRTFAHFEYEWLCAKYNVTPNMDVYIELVDAIKKSTGIEITRKTAKTLFLGILYGMGGAKLAAQLGIGLDEAKKIKEALLTAIPSIGGLTKSITQTLKMGDPIRTWGGRQYYCEAPRIINEGAINQKTITFEYKGVNILCQGSAADETKEAVIRYHEGRDGSRLLLQVHDEIVICCEKHLVAQEMAHLKKSMEGLALDVPMLSTGEVGYRWGQMEEYAE